MCCGDRLRSPPKADAEAALFNSYPKSTDERPASRLSDRYPHDHVSVGSERCCLGSGSHRHSKTQRENCRAPEDFHDCSCSAPSLHPVAPPPQPPARTSVRDRPLRCMQVSWRCGKQVTENCRCGTRRDGAMCRAVERSIRGISVTFATMRSPSERALTTKRRFSL